MSSSEDIKRKILIRLNQDGLQSNATQELLDDLIGEVCAEIAAENYYYELVKSVVDETDENGMFRLTTPSIPYQVFIYGTEGTDHSWQRITPVTYDYFIRWKDGVFRGGYNTSGVGGGMYGGMLRRYTVIPSGDDDTVIQLLEFKSKVSINMYYYPIKPTPADFPGYFEPLIITKVLYQYAINNRESSSQNYFELLGKRIKELKRTIKKTATQIEIVSSPNSPYNTRTRDWMSSNDLGFYRGI
jgi:hypothetical protein